MATIDTTPAGLVEAKRRELEALEQGLGVNDKRVPAKGGEQYRIAVPTFRGGAYLEAGSVITLDEGELISDWMIPLADAPVIDRPQIAAVSPTGPNPTQPQGLPPQSLAQGSGPQTNAYQPETTNPATIQAAADQARPDDGLDGLTKAELADKMKERGIEAGSTANKADMLDALRKG